jgi:hypothetical protein
MDKATEFFKYGVLPELVGKWYTRVPLTSPDMQLPMQESSSSSEPTKTPQTSTEQKWCYCNGEESGNMIGCENDDCAIQWFYVECLKSSVYPRKHGIVQTAVRENTRLRGQRVSWCIISC